MTSTDDWSDWAEGQDCPLGRNANGTCFNDPAQDWDSPGSLGVEDTYRGAQERSMLDLMSQGAGAFGTMGGETSASVAPPSLPSMRLPPPPRGADRADLVPWTWGRGGAWYPSMDFLEAGKYLKGRS